MKCLAASSRLFLIDRAFQQAQVIFRWVFLVWLFRFVIDENNFAPKLLFLSGVPLLPFFWPLDLGRTPDVYVSAGVWPPSRDPPCRHIDVSSERSSSSSPSTLCSELVWLSHHFFFDAIFSFPSCVSFSEFSLVSLSSASCWVLLPGLHGMILFVSAFVLILFASAFVLILVLPQGPSWHGFEPFRLGSVVDGQFLAMWLFITNSACLHLPVVPQSARCLSSATHLDFNKVRYNFLQYHVGVDEKRKKTCKCVESDICKSVWMLSYR